jgi:excisionase family DNA binding protein
MPQFITISEATIALHISRPTINRRIKAGEIPSIKLGNRVLIPLLFIECLQEKAMKSQTPGAE